MGPMGQCDIVLLDEVLSAASEYDRDDYMELHVVTEGAFAESVREFEALQSRSTKSASYDSRGE